MQKNYCSSTVGGQKNVDPPVSAPLAAFSPGSPLLLSVLPSACQGPGGGYLRYYLFLFFIFAVEQTHGNNVKLNLSP